MYHQYSGLPGLVCLSCTAEYQNREQEYSGIILVFGSAAQADFQIFGRIFGGTLTFIYNLCSFPYCLLLSLPPSTFSADIMYGWSLRCSFVILHSPSPRTMPSPSLLCQRQQGFATPSYQGHGCLIFDLIVLIMRNPC